MFPGNNRRRLTILLLGCLLSSSAQATSLINRMLQGCGCPTHARPGLDADGLPLPLPGPMLGMPEDMHEAVPPLPPAATPAPVPVPAPLPAPAAPAVKPREAALEQVGAYTRAGFDALGAFPCLTDDRSATDILQQIPARIRQLDGRQVLVRGFMLPLKVEQGRTTEFLLLSDPSLCCYGVMPAPNHWIIVRLPKGTPLLMDVPLEFSGRLRVGPAYEQGMLAGIYQLDDARLAQAR